MKNMIISAFLLCSAGLNAQPCESGAPSGGSYSYNPGDSTGTACVIWQVDCGDEVFLRPQSVMDTMIFLELNDTVFVNGFSSLYDNLVLLPGDTMSLTDLLFYEGVKTGLNINIEQKSVSREENNTDLIKILGVDKEYTVIISSNKQSNTSWSVDIKKSPSISNTRDEKVVLCEGREMFWVSQCPYPNKVWQTPNGEVFGDSVLLSIPGKYLWEHPCGVGDLVEVIPLKLTTGIITSHVTCTDSVDFFINSNGVIHWSTGESAKIIRVKQGNYSVTITDSYSNCPIIIDTTVWYPLDDIYFPNAFSPNGDGINDEFCTYMGPEVELNNFELKIFDRWGEEVFSTTDPAGCWDGNFRGKPMPQGSYAYFFRNKDCERKGFFTLVR
jgi:gliding motility-associated-like protein